MPPAVIEGIPRSLGAFHFDTGKAGTVVISNEGADGYVSIDGIQFVPREIADEERAGKRDPGYLPKP